MFDLSTEKGRKQVIDILDTLDPYQRAAFNVVCYRKVGDSVTALSFLAALSKCRADAGFHDKPKDIIKTVLAPLTKQQKEACVAAISIFEASYNAVINSDEIFEAGKADIHGTVEGLSGRTEQSLSDNKS